MTDSNFLPATLEIVRSISLLPSGLSDSRPFMNLSSLSQTPNFRRENCLETIIHSTSSIRNSQQRPFPSPGFLGFFSIFFWWVLEMEDWLLLLTNRCRKNGKKLRSVFGYLSFPPFAFVGGGRAMNVITGYNIPNCIIGRGLLL